MYSCVYCDYQDTSRMVQCDVCNRWAHFECADVDETIEDFPWLCVMCLEKSLKEKEDKLEKKSKDIDAREKHLMEKTNEVDKIIEEAIASIQTEFRSKTAALRTMEGEAKEKLDLADRMMTDLEMRESALKVKEARLMGREKNVNANERETEVDVGMKTTSELNENNFLDVLPINETEFASWDKLIKRKKEEMIRFYLDINMKSDTKFIKQCIVTTFTEEFILGINFEATSFINHTNILGVLIATVHRKFPNLGWDDAQAKSKIAKVFRQYRETDRKRNK